MWGKPSADQPPVPRPVSTTAGALWQEFEAIHGAARPACTRNGHDGALRDYYDAALQKQQSALCLSGGGIRSAAFSLGVLQDLARRGLLAEFHYLSTVSGGGYIGGWLAALLHGCQGDAAKVQQRLGSVETPFELRALRSYTNFLTPRPGISSPDTWAGILLWVRNVLVNWLIFVPALFAAALLPDLYRNALAAIGPGWGWPLLIVALICLFIGIYNGARHLPSHAPPAVMPKGGSNFVPLWVVVPLLAWSGLVPLVAAPWLRIVMPEDAILGDVIPPLGFCVMELAFVIAAFRSAGQHQSIFKHNLGWWTLASFVAAFILWLELDLAIGLPVIYIAVLGPLAVTIAHLMQSLIYVALRTEAFRGDLDREWLARLNAEKVMPALLWAIFAAVCLLLPKLILDNTSTFTSFLVSAFGLLTGPLAAYIGNISSDMSGKEGTSRRFQPSSNVVLGLIAAVFAATLFMLLARLGWLLAGDHVGGDLILLAIAGVLAWALGRHVNVNRFSLHAVYRNRLVRAFLGTARPKRHPDDFTGLDPDDNPRMAELEATRPATRRLFPVVNVTLNLTASRNTAWTERKGESFTITPCSCGAAYLHKREDVAAGLPVRGAYVRTELYAGGERETGPGDSCRGITLGTALAVSGAAASPNMGYHSSPGAAFLMTLFNVRLGAWLPNPAIASTRELGRAKPPNALITLLRELLGMSDDRGGAVYLSDGGHFENLGLYEMIRRRCRRILVIDAGEDPNASFQDLGNAIRKIRIDFDVVIEFTPQVAIGSRQKPLEPFRSFAYATIRYPESDAMGELLYLKPADLADVSMDVRSYRNLHETFPHQSTLEQFYGESQFESYRELGRCENSLLAPGATTLEAFFDGARRQAPPPPLLLKQKPLQPVAIVTRNRRWAMT
jgi:succinate dehydrogenase/fumarate reductase cytochrome b subunit